jgi:hypothetical protein
MSEPRSFDARVSENLVNFETKREHLESERATLKMTDQGYLEMLTSLCAAQEEVEAMIWFYMECRAGNAEMKRFAAQKFEAEDEFKSHEQTWFEKLDDDDQGANQALLEMDKCHKRAKAIDDEVIRLFDGLKVD